MVRVFEEGIRALVQEVTNDKRLHKANGKPCRRPVSPGLSDRAKLIRIADKIVNVRDVTHNSSAHWDLARRREGLDWTEQVDDQLPRVNPRLEATHDRVLRGGRVFLLNMAMSRTHVTLRDADERDPWQSVRPL